MFAGRSPLVDENKVSPAKKARLTLMFRLRFCPRCHWLYLKALFRSGRSDGPADHAAEIGFQAITSISTLASTISGDCTVDRAGG